MNTPYVGIFPTYGPHAWPPSLSMSYDPDQYQIIPYPTEHGFVFLG